MKKTASLPNIKKEKISDQVYRLLKEKIVSGQWPVGYRIPSEPELSEQFGVSRISVRTALQKLAALGLLDIRVGDGTFVTAVSVSSYVSEIGSLLFRPKSYMDIAQLRRAIELESGYFAAVHATPEQLEILHGYLEELLEAVRGKDVDAYMESDRKFHRYVAEISKNELFVSMFDFFETIWSGFIVQLKDSYFPAMFTIQEENIHVLLFEAIRTGDFNNCSDIYRRTNLIEIQKKMKPEKDTDRSEEA